MNPRSIRGGISAKNLYVGYAVDISVIFTACWPWCNTPPSAQLTGMPNPPMPAKPKEPHPRLIIPMPKRLITQIDEYRWANRIPSRAEAIRQLIKEGLRTKK